MIETQFIQTSVYREEKKSNSYENMIIIKAVVNGLKILGV